jgi:hypothetical protein
MTGAANGPDRHGDHRREAPDMICGWQNAATTDLANRTSRDGRTVCIDATHEGLGRQMHIVPIGPILDHPPRVEGGNAAPRT